MTEVAPQESETCLQFTCDGLPVVARGGYLVHPLEFRELNGQAAVFFGASCAIGVGYGHNLWNMTENASMQRRFLAKWALTSALREVK